MSKSNGNGQTPTPDDLRMAAELAIKLTTEATNGPYRLEDSGKGNGGKYLQRVLKAAKNWRRRPVPGAKTWPEFDDVASIMGGMSEQALKNGKMLAAAPELLKMLARGILELQASTHNDKLKPAIGGFTPTKTVVDWYYFLTNAANALDCLIPPDHRLGKHPVDAMLGGSTDDRKNRAAVLRSLADVLDPSHDEARKRAKHRNERLNGIPTVDDFLRMLPDSLREVLHMAVTCESEMEIARLDLEAQRRWNLPSEAIRHLVRVRMAWAHAWEHYDQVQIEDEFLGQREPRSKLEKRDYFYDEALDLAVTIVMDQTWLAEHKYDAETLFAKVMVKAPSGRGVMKDVFGVFLKDNIAIS